VVPGVDLVPGDGGQLRAGVGAEPLLLSSSVAPSEVKETKKWPVGDHPALLTLGEGHQFVVGEEGPGSGSGVRVGRFPVLAFAGPVFVGVGL
jgi:hypothetical protein